MPFTKETWEALKLAAEGKLDDSAAAALCEPASEQLSTMVGLLVESWDALAAVVKVHHLKLHNISPTLCERIEKALEPWTTGEPR